MKPVITYEIFRLGDAQKKDYPYPEGWEYLDVDSEWDYGLWRCEQGVPVEFIGQDGGEPEDQTLGRDWRWVTAALKAAFDEGRRWAAS